MTLRIALLTALLIASAFLNACVAGPQTAPAENPANQAPVSERGNEQVARVSVIADSAKVVAAFKTIQAMREKNIERLIEINEIPAPPFQEDARAKDLVKRFERLGLSNVNIDEVGNVLARRSGTQSKHTVAVVAHIDTVFPPETDVTVRQQGNVFHAPGIGDNTRGVVVLLSLLEALEHHDIQTQSDVLLIGSVGEEGLGDLRGVRHLFRQGGPKIDSFIAIDGGKPNRLITRAVGSNRYRVTFQGPGGHSYGAYGRAHPHQALADAITRFKLNATPITAQGTKATFSVGQIGGGTSINSIPFESWMEVDMRSEDPSKLAQLDVAFQNAVQSALTAENERRQSNDPLTVDIKNVGKRPAGANPPNTSLVLNASAALIYSGLTPELRASSTDANVPISLSVPAITMSRGGKSRNAHAPNESWEDIDSHEAIQTLLLTLLMEAGYTR
ncbi:MAG: M20/M25/M40 family metallo-hydrolase [Gammaproteobacteria bacterium]